MAKIGNHAGAGNLTATVVSNVLMTVPGATWTAAHAPAANTQATASKAAGAAGVRHVCTGILVTLSAGASAPTAVQSNVSIRDGASGAGTVLWSAVIAVPAVAGQAAFPIQLSELSLVGSAATAMTIEFGAASGANTIQAVSMQGYSVN